ncbi:hypothetical protein ACIQPQ_21070 [Streptomyces sp. NPDC091281]|uniref:hypothetical protein n=1 Tax=Streptomyces sp. NPDC091281 TaxID=3365985 RepID=UPI00380C88E8
MESATGSAVFALIRRTPVTAASISQAAADLASDLERGERPEPTCTAQELALHFAIRDADDRDIEGDAAGDHGRLPNHRDDYDFDASGEFHRADYTEYRWLKRRPHPKTSKRDRTAMYGQ